MLSQAQALIRRRLGLPANAGEEAVLVKKKYEAAFDTTLTSGQMLALKDLTEKATLGAAPAQVIPADA